MKLKLLLAALLVPGLSMAAIWPETLGPWHRAASLQAVLADRPIWDEYGLKESEAARYENGDARFTATAWRLQDPTAALAAFDWQRPASSTPSKLAPVAVETADTLLALRGKLPVFLRRAQARCRRTDRPLRRLAQPRYQLAARPPRLCAGQRPCPQ